MNDRKIDQLWSSHVGEMVIANHLSKCLEETIRGLKKGHFTPAEFMNRCLENCLIACSGRKHGFIQTKENHE